MTRNIAVLPRRPAHVCILGPTVRSFIILDKPVCSNRRNDRTIRPARQPPFGFRHRRPGCIGPLIPLDEKSAFAPTTRACITFFVPRLVARGATRIAGGISPVRRPNPPTQQLPHSASRRNTRPFLRFRLNFIVAITRFTHMCCGSPTSRSGGFCWNSPISVCNGADVLLYQYMLECCFVDVLSITPFG